MTGQIITCDHRAWALPPLLEWNVVHTGGVPCDSFSAVCVYTPDMAERLHQAVSFIAMNGGTLLLHGFVDEYEIVQSAAGRTVTLTGRGLAGRLLDNESRPMTYQSATLTEIVRNHVTPYGISCKELAGLAPVEGYTVAAGSSQWKALEDFCRRSGNFSPRFDRAGALLAAPESGGRTVRIDDGTALLEVRKREDHYGVISEMLVIDKTRNAAYTVENQDYRDRGGQRRRVVYTPGQSTWAAMRYTGQYQIARSREDEVTVTVVLPGIVMADAGDTAVLALSGSGLCGNYRVAAVEHALTERGETTTLTLKERA